MRLGRAVAVKTTQERFKDRFQPEARPIASLNHPSMCTLHDVGPNYLAMEQVERSGSCTIRHWCSPVPGERVRPSMWQCATALVRQAGIARLILAFHWITPLHLGRRA